MANLDLVIRVSPFDRLVLALGVIIKIIISMSYNSYLILFSTFEIDYQLVSQRLMASKIDGEEHNMDEVRWYWSCLTPSTFTQIHLQLVKPNKHSRTLS